MASGPYRLRIGDDEQLFERVDAILALIDAGSVDGATLVRPPGSARWLPLRSVPELAARLPPDPWAAWEDADEDSMKESLADLRAGCDEDEPVDDEATDPGQVLPPPTRRPEPAEELSAVHIRPLDEPRRARADPPGVLDLPAHALTPIDEAEAEAEAEAPLRPAAQGRRGQVIVFPGGGTSPRVAGSVALDPYAEPLPKPGGGGRPIPTLQPAPPQEAPPGGPQWWRVALVAGLGLGLLTAVQLYVGSTASAVFTAPVAPGGPGAGPAPRPPPPPDAEVAPGAPVEAPADLALGGTDAPQQGADAYLDMDNEIRGQWLERPRDIGGASGLEEALLVELPRVHVRVLKVRAPVTRWGGHKGQEPQAADFLIRYSPRPGERDRELAAIALVVGRYLSIYRLDSERLTVELEGPDGVLRRVRMPPKEALRLYEQQVSLVDFLIQLAGG